MRHKVKGRKLGRTAPHRKATMQALSVALIQERRIQTTLPKAKELRRFVEPLITRAKTDTSHNRRQVFSALQDKYAVTELFEEIGPATADRPGGYTRVLKIGNRLGDAAEMAVIELVDFNDVKPEGKEDKKKRTRRAGKSSKPVSEQKVAEEEAKPVDNKVKSGGDDVSSESKTTEESPASQSDTEQLEASADKEIKAEAEETKEATQKSDSKEK